MMYSTGLLVDVLEFGCLLQRGFSDDFRGYVWKIPEMQVLLEQRRETDAAEWLLEQGETIGTLRECRQPVPAPYLRSLAFTRSAGGIRRVLT